MKFEHTFVTVHVMQLEETHETLKRFSREGWELVSAVQSDFPGVTLFFKRERA